MRKDDFIGQQFYWFTGEVKEIADHNRVKVLCHGYYPQDIEKKDLPWATVMMPTTVAGTSTSSANHHLEEGSWVVGFFRDGMSAQDPIVIGSVAAEDIPSGSSKTNKVYNSQAGHKIELENKEGDEKITVTHAKGAVITIDKDNNLSIANSGTTSINSAGEITITSAVKTTIV